MSLRLKKSDWLWADLARQVDWYRINASPEVAGHFVDAVESTLKQLQKTPGVGRRRFSEWPELEGIHSFRVRQPFQRFLIFYRFNNSTLFAERLIHGARDLPRRVRQSPYEEE